MQRAGVSSGLLGRPEKRRIEGEKYLPWGHVGSYHFHSWLFGIPPQAKQMISPHLYWRHGHPDFC